MFSVFLDLSLVCPSFVPRFLSTIFCPSFFYFYVIFSYVVKQLFDDSYVKCFG